MYPTFLVAIVLSLALCSQLWLHLDQGNRHRSLLSKQQNHGIGIVHVGKSGGVAFRYTLENPRNPNKIYDRNPEWFHMTIPNPYKYKDWIAIVRDPIERIKSSFIFEHPKNRENRIDGVPTFQSTNAYKQFLYGCYDSIESLAVSGLDKSEPSKPCHVLARILFSGLHETPIPDMTHFSFNYDAYFTPLLQRMRQEPHGNNRATRLWVIRQEYMLEDANTVERAMGGDGLGNTTHFLHYQSSPSHGLPHHDLRYQSKFISPKGLDNLCHFLCREILIYRELFQRAKNLNLTDFYNGQTAQVCKRQASLETCGPEKVYPGDSILKLTKTIPQANSYSWD